MYFTNDQGLAGSSALCLHMTPDFGSIHGWPIRQICIFSSDPFILKGREQTHISLNLTPIPLSPETAKLSENTPKLWKTLGIVLWLFPKATSQEELRVKTVLPCRKCTMYSHTCLSVGSAAPSLPLTRAGKRHLQRPLLSVSLHFRKWTPCKEQNSSSSCQVGKRMPLSNAIICIHVHVTTNVMVTTETSNTAYPHY